MSNEKGKKILIAEDDGFIAEVYNTKLSSLGYQVTIAEDGQEALDHLAEEKFDLLMLDLMMPRVNGLTVLEQLRSNPETKTFPVLILTNAGEQESVDKASQLGVDGYLVKSNFTPEEVLNKVKGIIG